jgi:dihydroflavonol-4-reductase
LLKKILVTGGTGFIGSHLVERLVKEKMNVRCLIRETSNTNWIQGLDVEFVIGDLSDIASLHGVVTGVDTIFHLAGQSRGSSDKDFYESNVVGTMNLLKAVIQTGTKLKRFIFLSSQAAAGPCPDDKPVIESDDCNPISPYGSSKLAAEEAIRVFHPQIPLTIIRSPAVYGPRDTDFYPLFRSVKKGIKPIIGWKDNYISFIYVQDLVNGLLLSAGSKKTIGKTYYMLSDRQISYRDFENIIAKAQVKRALTLRIPIGIAYLFAFILEGILKLFGKSINLTHYKIRELTQRYWLCDDTCARQELDYHPKVFIEEGIARCVAWYRQADWL